MSVIVLDNLRNISVTDNGSVTDVTISSTGMQGPQGLPTTVNGHTGAVITLTASDVGAVPTSAEGAANGVATLDSGGHVPIGQIPVTTLATDFVDLATNQTIATGIKTFSISPVVPTPTTSTQAANKGYADLMLPLAGGTMTGALTLAADPIANLQPATKQYVDGVASGLNVKTSATCATTTTLPTNTYSNGSSGVGATLTATATGVLTVDGHTVALNEIVLVQNEAAQADNGLYKCTTAGAVGVAYILTRVTTMDQATEISGAFSFVETGTVNAGSGFVVAGVGPYIVGTTAIVWTQFSGAGEITAGTGLTKSGNTLSLSTPVTITNGGTGQSGQTAAFDALSPNTTLGDMSYRGSSNNVRLAGSTSATKQFLTQTGNGTISAAPAWGVVSAADITTGILAITQGGTGSGTQNFVDLSSTQAAIGGAKTFTGAIVMSSTLTGAGRIRVATTGASSGSGGYMGQVAGAAPTSGTFVVGDWVIDGTLGTQWICVTAGTPGTWVALTTQVATQVLGTTTASVTFTNIPAFTRVTLFWRARVSASGVQTVLMQIDGNSGSGNYLWADTEATNGSSVAAGHATSTSITIGTADGNTASYFANGFQVIDGWANSTGYATSTGTWHNFSTNSTDTSGVIGGLFSTVGPHTSIKILLSANSFAAGSQLSLQGSM